jgi:hypothetical protein
MKDLDFLRDFLRDLREVTRFEVIDEQGRFLIIRPARVSLSLQDQGRTLKVFVEGDKLLRGKL